MKLKMPTSLQELLPALGVSQNWKLHSVPPDTWEIPTQNKICGCANNGINQNPPCWLCSFFFFPGTGLFFSKRTKEPIASSRLHFCSHCLCWPSMPIKKNWSWVSCSCFKGGKEKKKKRVKAFLMQKQEKKRRGGTGNQD